MASVNYANDQGGHLTPQNIYASPQQILWNSQQEENPRQNLVAFNEYSHINTFPNKQVSECGSRASLSPVSPTAFHPVTATCHQHTHLAAEYPSEAFTRRGSVLSDLVSHMDGIQLPSSSSSPTTHTPTNDMFVIEPRRGFGERRPQRPAALGPMRSTSSGATLTSPLLTDSTMSRSLRRVNTCGIPLNRSNRIQKHSLITTPQRSPTILSQAFERAMEQQQQQQYTPHILSQAVSPEAIDNFEEEKETIESDVVFNVNPPSVELTWNESRRGEFSVPPLSASLTGDDGSPPHTPLPGQESLVVPWSGQEMYPMTSNSVSSFTAHPSPTYIQEQARCFPSSSSDNSIPQYWEGTNTSDMFLAPRSFEADDPALAQIPRQDSPSSHYPSYSTMSRRNEALKIEFSHPHQEVRSQYYVPLRENQNYVFHEYNPDNARRGE